MRIAVYQMGITWENKNRNYLKVKRLLEACKKKNDILLLPEMSFTGFSMNTDITKESNLETLGRMTEYARQFQIAIGFGWVKDCGEKSENHYTIIDKAGETVSDYVKIHPFSFSGENQKFQAGNCISSFKFMDTRFASFICYDLRFPEIFQIASKSAHVILVPANWPQKRRNHWRCLLQARAIENQVYIIAINCVGEIGGLIYSGDSCVINPDGEILLEISNREGVLEYELLDDVDDFRNSFQLKKDRRVELYMKYAKGLL